MNLADLKKPFAPDRISWRVGSTNADKTKGMALAYIDARDVMSRLDEVCGMLWQCEYIPMPNGTCCCRIGVKAGEEWIWRSNGAINLTDSDKPDAKEMTEKGSYSDAFKRSAVLFGIGQYLYDLDSPWVAIEPMGRSYKIAAHEYKRLEGILRAVKGAPEPSKPAEDPDVTEGVKNWIAKHKLTIVRASKMPDLYAWLDAQGQTEAFDKPKSGSNLDRLKRKSPDAFEEIKAAYMEQLSEIAAAER